MNCFVSLELYFLCANLLKSFKILKYSAALWRNGSASDSRSEGCVFKSRRGHLKILFKINANSNFPQPKKGNKNLEIDYK